MKKYLYLFIVSLLFSILFTACTKDTKETSIKADTKDVTMLLSGIGGQLSSIESLGELPSPQVNGRVLFYNTKDVEGYFAGFNLEIELKEDNKTVNKVYLQPYDNNQIKVNGFIIGCDITDMNNLFGKGELSSIEDNGKVYTYMIYQDDNYVMKCTVDNSKVVAVSFNKIDDISNDDKSIVPDSDNQLSDNVVSDNTISNSGQSTDTVTEEDSNPIQLSFWMTKDDIIKALGDDYTFDIYEEYAYYVYSATMAYDGISFYFYYDEDEMPIDTTINGVNITSNKYTFNYDIKIGESATDAINYCEGKFEHAYNHHQEVDLTDMFIYTEDGKESTNWGPIISFEYNNDELNNNRGVNILDVFSENDMIKSISISYFLD